MTTAAELDNARVQKLEAELDPDRDIRKDHQGLLQLTRAGERMRNDLRGYFRSRNEDSIDLE